MSDDPDSRTEEPTGHRLSTASGEGNVVQSREVTSVLMLIAILVVVWLLGPSFMNRVLAIGRTFLERPDQLPVDSDNFARLFSEVIYGLGIALAFTFGVLILAAYLSGYLQHGFMFNPGLIKFDPTKIDPIKGAQRFFKLRGLVEQVKNIAKITLIAAVSYILLWPKMVMIETFATAGIGALAHAMVVLTIRLLAGVVALMVAIALLDYLYQRYEFYKNLKMTKQEVKDEYKNQEGDPEVKGRQRKIRNEKSRMRMMAQVARSTVVVTNPTHFAVALLYDQTMAAPRVVAKGKDLIALRIRDLARKNFVPIVENPQLARTLYATVALDHEVHPEHFKAVAEVIGYVMRLRRRVFS